MKRIKNLIFIGYRPKTNSLISLNEYSFPIETGGANKTMILDIDFLKTMFNVRLLIFNYKSCETISKEIKCTPLTLFEFIQFLITFKEKDESLFIIKNTLILGLIIKLILPFSKSIMIIERPYRYAAWDNINMFVGFRIIYFLLSYLSLISVNKIIVDRSDNWVLKTNFPFVKYKSVFLPNPIDPSIYYPENKEARNTKQLLYIGRLNHRKQKNPELLFKSFSLLAKEMPNIKLTVVGGELSDIQDLIQDKEILEKIVFIKNIPCNEVAKFYRENDLTLLTSFYEGIPNIILESLASATPCIVTNVLEEGLIINGTNGYICKSFQEQEFSELIKKGLILSEHTKKQNKSLLDPKFLIDNRNKCFLEIIKSLEV